MGVTNMARNELATKKINPYISRLKFLRLEREKTRQAQIKRRESIHIFTPRNNLEMTALTIASEGNTGWKKSLYSLNYVDRYREHICFIFATEPAGSKEQQWLLVNFDSRTEAKYWIVLGEHLLSEVYYAWAKVAQKSHAQFDLQKMKTIGLTPYQGA